MGDYINVKEIFGCDVFNDSVMQDRLPKKVYRELKKTIEEGKELSMEIADVVAHEMKEWAIEKGATHYCHWFQPLTGVTAEKHDAFVTAPREDGKVLLSFSCSGAISPCRPGNIPAQLQRKALLFWKLYFRKGGEVEVPVY